MAFSFDFRIGAYAHECLVWKSIHARLTKIEQCYVVLRVEDESLLEPVASCHAQRMTSQVLAAIMMPSLLGYVATGTRDDNVLFHCRQLCMEVVEAEDFPDYML